MAAPRRARRNGEEASPAISLRSAKEGGKRPIYITNNNVVGRVRGRRESRVRIACSGDVEGLFPPGQGATIGVDFMIKTVEVENEKVKLQIWDTAGQERFRSITQSYYRSAHALILVYDISCQPTFDCLPDWLREIEEYASNKVLRILVGNKIDREDREIPTHVGEDFAQRHGMYFLETSAKEAENVERLFMEIAAELMEQARSKELPRYETNTTSINGKTTSIGDSSNCGCSRLS
ncbi:PREDICTED: ras-related protein Rab-30 isoform X1 [Vollenhovia emeryi]|nr:PREDICTED: ras-related protein Rab-30 isoform X1 [Vollenhovia emeryi]